MKNYRKSFLQLVMMMAAVALFPSCTKEEVFPSDRVCLSVGESRVVALDNSVEIFEDSVRLLYEDTGVCGLSDITPHQLTVTGLHKGVDILHIEYATKRGKTGYGGLELRIEVE